MIRRDDLEACRSLLERYNGRANARWPVDILADLMSHPLIDPALVPIIVALRELEDAKDCEDLARQRTTDAGVRLAELVGVKRRDKDTGFDAEFEAQRMIVTAAIEGLPRPSWRQEPSS
jgi:hypothetical protein